MHSENEIHEAKTGIKLYMYRYIPMYVYCQERNADIYTLLPLLLTPHRNRHEMQKCAKIRRTQNTIAANTSTDVNPNSTVEYYVVQQAGKDDEVVQTIPRQASDSLHTFNEFHRSGEITDTM